MFCFGIPLIWSASWTFSKKKDGGKVTCHVDLSVKEGKKISKENI